MYIYRHIIYMHNNIYMCTSTCYIFLYRIGPMLCACAPLCSRVFLASLLYTREVVEHACLEKSKLSACATRMNSCSKACKPCRLRCRLRGSMSNMPA